MDLADAKRAFSRKRGRGSKYDDVIARAEQLARGKALLLEGLTYSEVTGLHKRLADVFGTGWSVRSTKVDTKKKLYDVLVHREP